MRRGASLGALVVLALVVACGPASASGGERPTRTKADERLEATFAALESVRDRHARPSIGKLLKRIKQVRKQGEKASYPGVSWVRTRRQANLVVEGTSVYRCSKCLILAIPGKPPKDHSKRARIRRGAFFVGWSRRDRMVHCVGPVGSKARPCERAPSIRDRTVPERGQPSPGGDSALQRCRGRADYGIGFGWKIKVDGLGCRRAKEIIRSRPGGPEHEGFRCRLRERWRGVGCHCEKERRGDSTAKLVYLDSGH